MQTCCRFLVWVEPTITAEFRSQESGVRSLNSEVKLAFYLALRSSLCTAPKLKSAVL
jgi:hypothetical protein